MNQQIQDINIDKIKLDFRNPRISEFGVNQGASEEKILKILWEEMAVNELLLSIVSNGFWKYEPLILLKENAHYLVIEGNRRIAAIKLIHYRDRYKIPIPSSIESKITKKLLDETENVPSIIVSSREEAWKFIGFKHVNGPAKWGSYAKAKYIAEIHNDYQIPLNDIADQIGDTNKTAQKLYQGLMVLEQAKKQGVYDYMEDILSDRLYFSHLYTGIQRDGIRSFLNIKDAEEESPDPVPAENLNKLGEFLTWLYGSKKSDVRAVIGSQNPDLKLLDEILKSREAISALRDGESLEYSFELSRSSDAVFEESLLAAKRNLQKARGYLSNGYDGEESLLRVAGSVANLADDLYNEMDKMHNEKLGVNKRKRLTE